MVRTAFLSIALGFTLLAMSADLVGARERFLELPGGRPHRTPVIDLQTVEVIGPGQYRATQIMTSSGEATRGLLQIKLEMLSFCDRGGGSYPATPEMFPFGNPDAQVHEVKVNETDATWVVPYIEFWVSASKPYAVNVPCVLYDSAGERRFSGREIKRFVHDLTVQELKTTVGFDCRRTAIGRSFGRLNGQLAWSFYEDGMVGASKVEAFCDVIAK